MRLDGRRLSTNVDDRRAMSGSTKKAGLGIGGLIIVGLITWMMGGNPLSVLTQGLSIENATGTTYTPTAEDEELAKFASQILAGTEDVWTKEFQKMGKTYVAPKMVLFNGAVNSGCGSATASTGPFYCSADQTVYLDLSFFRQMKEELGADGDFAYAYVVAHEVGHHVQYLLGILQKVSAQQRQVSKTDANHLNVRLELQADFFAGLWAYHDNKDFSSLEDGDIEEGLRAASAIGDDRLQQQAQGYTVPDSFNHGTSKQRNAWLKKGLMRGEFSDGDTFSPEYEYL